MNRYTGKICVKHPKCGGERQFKSHKCVGCHRVRMITKRARRRLESESFRAKERKKQAERLARPGYKAERAAFRARPAVKKRKKAYMQEYRQRPERKSAHASGERLRQAQMHKATPPWADRSKILAKYTEARRRGLTVDHIFPLRGKHGCGLHVHNNLRIVSRSVNSAKGNRLGDLSEC